METVEIVLIIIGFAFFIASCFVQEKFSKKDIQELAKMSETEFKLVIEKQLSSARVRAEEAIEGIIDDSLEVTRRGLDKETNKKIMAVSEYSDTILESMNKTHNEIMFLYSMLNDKHVELTQFANSLKQITSQKVNIAENKNPIPENQAVEERHKDIIKENESIPSNDIPYDVSMFDNMEEYSKNEKILLLHKSGKSDVEIAKDLECGLGEVRLVLGLYKEEQM